MSMKRPRGDGAGRQGEITAPFVERRTYRRRRLMDTARLLPILGAVLFAVPLMWPDPDPYPAPGSHGGMRMSSAITYIFLVWAGLIIVSIAFGAAVRRWAEHWTAGGGYDEGTGEDLTQAAEPDMSTATGD